MKNRNAGGVRNAVLVGVVIGVLVGCTTVTLHGPVDVRATLTIQCPKPFNPEVEVDEQATNLLYTL